MPERPAGTPLAGRVLTIGSGQDIALRPGEVVLTFDDGPRPGRTEAILDALAAHGVSATFMMLGEAAQRHPELVRRVALAGHTIGSHTFGHPDLARMSNAAAMGEIAAGEQALAAALAPIGRRPSTLFRFPYLSQTGFLNTSLTHADFIVLGVDIDSKDYFRDTPATVLARTLERLERRGSGVILFHDIHARTVALLPDLLDELSQRGYRVVHLRTRDADPLARSLLTAEAN